MAILRPGKFLLGGNESLDFSLLLSSSLKHEAKPLTKSRVLSKGESNACVIILKSPFFVANLNLHGRISIGKHWPGTYGDKATFLYSQGIINDRTRD